jgi:hypothetical protein
MKTADPFEGMTAFDCCTGCSADKCTISGINVCAHPRKTGFQSNMDRVPGAFERCERAKRILAVQKAERTAE